MSWADALARVFPLVKPGHGGRGRVLAALALCTLLAGCGFTPLYGDRDAAFDEELRSIQVLPIPERIGQRLAIELRDSLNPSGVAVAPRHYLAITLTKTRSESAIRRDATASREQFVVTANVVLRSITDNEPEFSAVTTAYNAVELVDNEYSIIVAERDVEARAAREIAEDIRTRVALYFKGKKDRATAAKRT